MDKAYGYTEPLERVAVEYVLAHMIRRPHLFSVARTLLKRVHFDSQLEYPHGVLWQSTCDLVEKYGTSPSLELLGAHAISLLRTEPMSTTEMEAELTSLLNWLWSAFPDEASFQDTAALDMFRQFLRERAVNERLKQALLASAGRMLTNLPELLQESMHNLAQIDAMQETETVDIIPQEMETREVRYIRTNVGVIDERMDGGSKPGEVHVLLAPTGVGKTMEAVEISCARARSQVEEEQAKQGSGKLSVLFSFEGDSDDESVPLASRVMCYAAEIHKSRIEHMRNYNELSRTGNLLEYEQLRFREEISRGQVINGEYERLMEAREWVNRFVHVADFSMSRRNGKTPRGAGGVPEMRQYLDFIANKYKREIGTVVIDWAGQCVLRKLQHDGHKDAQKALPVELMNFVDSIRSDITTKHGCDAWVLHQLNGEANGKGVTAELHHSMALWCATFAVNAWFAFVLGNKDKTNNTCMLWATKTRRGESKAGTLCFIDGAFGRLMPATHCSIDSITGRVVNNEDVRRFGGSTPLPPALGVVSPAGF